MCHVLYKASNGTGAFISCIGTSTIFVTESTFFSTSAGTISIPKQFRKYMDIQKGEYVKVILGKDRLIVRKITIS